MAKLFLIFTLLTLSAPLMASDIQNIRIGEHPDKVRLVINFTGDANFNAQTQANPNKLDIHFNKKSFNNQKTIPWKYPFKSIQTKTIKDRFTHLSLPLSSPHSIQSAFVIEGQPNRLVIDITKGEGHETLHGPLNIDDTVDKTIHAKQNPTIMIDAGHGGHDPGAISPSGIQEKNITLSIAKTLAKTLNDTGRFRAKLTRDRNKFIGLHERVKIAQDANADLFISIHADSLRGTQTTGASVYTLSKEASDEQTAKLAARENLSDTLGDNYIIDTNTDVHEILFDMAMTETMADSKELAADVVVALRQSNIKMLKGPHRHAGFAVLKAPDIPSILFETGFVSTETQAQQLMNPAYQKQLSKALVKALDRYFEF